MGLVPFGSLGFGVVRRVVAEARSKPRHYPPNYKNRYYTEVQQPVTTLQQGQRAFLQTTNNI